MIKLFYEPWGILAGMIGGVLAGAALQVGLETGERRGKGTNGDRSHQRVARSGLGRRT